MKVDIELIVNILTVLTAITGVAISILMVLLFEHKRENALKAFLEDKKRRERLGGIK